jgi:lipoate-protein ligase B
MLLDRGGVRTSVLTYHTPGAMLVGCSRDLKRVTAEAFVTNLDQAPLMNKPVES